MFRLFFVLIVALFIPSCAVHLTPPQTQKEKQNAQLINDYYLNEAAKKGAFLFNCPQSDISTEVISHEPYVASLQNDLSWEWK